MTRVAFIRHGLTRWNLQQRIQGRTDTPLSDTGRKQVGTWQLPIQLQAWSWFVSPLQRARQTAELLGGTLASVEPRLTEMHWGEWEGELSAELRARLGDAVLVNEARGLDFRPPGGESPRDVQGRVLEWCAELARNDGDVIAVTHKGVIRAVYAAASGWDMRSAPAQTMQWQCAHIFHVNRDGQVSVHALNVSLCQIKSAP
ncbi:MAG: histidine phosphatase family protein [Gammaproteobacteria bacterium]|nr:histidine phosphatase family protein [Gammaproteobacteria bacterium]